MTRRDFIKVAGVMSLEALIHNGSILHVAAGERLIELAPPPKGLDKALDDILKRFFNGDHDMFKHNVEELRLEQTLYEKAVPSAFELEWYTRDAADKAFFLIHTSGNPKMSIKPGTHAVCYMTGGLS